MTGLFIIIVVIFGIMTAFPFLLALGIPKGEQVTLVVRDDNGRDPRYFVQSFKKKIKSALDKGTANGVLALSKQEPFFYAEALPEGKETIERIVICKEDFLSKQDMVFDKEIYSEQNVVLAKGTQARAVAAKELLLQEKTTVFRWSDGEEAMYACRECDLGISATSKEYLQVMENCTFHRLFAPQIDILAQDENQKQERRNPETDSRMGTKADGERELVEKDIKIIEKNQVVNGNVITRYALVIEEGAVIFGHIKSRKSIQVKKGAKIDGNLFADGKIVLEEDVCLTGELFSQQDISVGAGCVIGQKGKIKSVIAKENIALHENVTVYGYVGCEGIGRTLLRKE